jgi:hypothetical protein
MRDASWRKKELFPKLISILISSSRMDIFVVGSDRAMYHRYSNGGDWQPIDHWENLGGAFAYNSSPTAVTWAPHRIDIFAQGKYNHILHKAWDGNSWLPSQTGEWEDLGGNIRAYTSPTAVSWGRQRADIFVVGIEGDIYHKAMEMKKRSSPGHGPGDLDYYYMDWYPSKNGWESLAGKIYEEELESSAARLAVTSPAAVSWGPNKIDVFVVGTDKGVYHKAWDGHDWWPSRTGNWHPLGGKCRSTPAAVSWGPNRIDLFAVGSDRSAYHKYWNGRDWQPSSDWEPYFGKFSGSLISVSPEAEVLYTFGIGSENNARSIHANRLDRGPRRAWDDIGGKVGEIDMPR